MEETRNRQMSSHFYINTLQSWLIYNDYEIYEDVLKYFESLELYPVCDGIKKALIFIEFVLYKRFKDAEINVKDIEDVVLGRLQDDEFERHRAISRLVYKDILTEIYGEQIRNFAKGN